MSSPAIPQPSTTTAAATTATSTISTIENDINTILPIAAQTAEQLSPNSTGTKVLTAVAAVEPTIMQFAMELVGLFKAIFSHKSNSK